MQTIDTNQFNSIGFRDPFLLSVSNSGTLLYNKQFGSQKDDIGWGISMLGDGDPVICGSHTRDLNITANLITSYSGFSQLSDGLNHVYLEGDNTVNSFVTNAVFSQTPVHYYYHGISESPGLFGEIEDEQTLLTAPDTVYLCPEERIFYNPYTFPHSGPDYNYQWSNGLTTSSIELTFNQTISVQVERIDGCASDSDTIYVFAYPMPVFPLLVDDHDFNIGLPQFYNDIQLCSPDSAILNFSALAPGYSFSFSGPDVTINDIIDSIVVDTEGTYYITITNPWCSFYDTLYVEVDSPLAYDSIVLGIEPFEFVGDSISVCFNESFILIGIDSISNPNSVDSIINQPFFSQIWTITPNDSTIITPDSNTISSHAYVSVSGWYTINLFLALGYSNLCGLDTVEYRASRTIYVTVNPQPIIPDHPILGSNLLCLNGSLYLYVEQTDPQMYWDSNNPILWTSAGGDSIRVDETGTYFYGDLDYTDSVTGCKNSGGYYFTVSSKVAPEINSAGNSNIICPNDSVILTLPNTYTSYQWLNPNGIDISSTNTSIAEDQGFYTCQVVDNEGCVLTTVPFELNEYTTPTLFVTPSNILCAGDSKMIAINYDGNNAVINWLNPIALGNTDEFTTSTIGTYTCQISACGVTTVESVSIISGDFLPTITISDSLLCYEEDAIISSTPINASFNWNNSSASGSVFTTNEAGEYFAEVTNEFGCTVNTDTVIVSLVENSFPPNISNASICIGTTFTFNDASLLIPNWYSSDTTLIINSTIFETQILNANTNYLVAYPNTECPLVYTNVLVSIVPPLPTYSVQGEPLICSNSVSDYSVNATSENLQWQVNGTNVSGADSVIFTYNSALYPSASVLSVQISNLCYSTTVSFNVQEQTIQNLTTNNDSIIICPNQIASVFLNNSNLDSISWTGNFGSETSDTLFYNSSLGNGTINVNAIDNLGCPTNQLTLAVYLPTIDYSFNIDSVGLCIGQTVNVSLNTNADYVQWVFPNQTFDTTSFNFQITEGGLHILNQWNNFGCSVQDSFQLSALPIPVFDIPSDTLYCISDYLSYVGIGNSANFFWTTLQGDTEIPSQEYQSLILTAMNQNGCSYIDTFVVISQDCIEVVPNIFTPNNDGINDFLYLGPEFNLKSSKLVIVNRWGQSIYQTEGYQNNFNGSDLLDGVYFYTFYQDFKSHPELQTKGFFHLIR